jgi:hypothetical protein
MKSFIKALALIASVLGVLVLACEAVKFLYETYGKNYIEVMDEEIYE